MNLAFRLLSWLLCQLPFPVSTWLACRVGDVMYLLSTSRRKIASQNLERAFSASLTPKRRAEIARGAFQSTAVSLAELFMMPKMVKEVHSRIRFFNRRYLDDAFRQGKGVILVVSHLGSWEYLAFLPILMKRRLSVVVKNIRDPGLDQHVNALRRMTTINPIPKKDSIKQAVRELKQNHAVTILIDQWAGPEGLWQDFFGSPTSTTSIPARLALRFGSALVPAFCFRTSAGHYDIEICAPLSAEGCDESQITHDLNALLESQIERHPEQWLWTHRRWKAKPLVIREPALPSSSPRHAAAP